MIINTYLQYLGSMASIINQPTNHYFSPLAQTQLNRSYFGRLSDLKQPRCSTLLSNSMRNSDNDTSSEPITLNQLHNNWEPKTAFWLMWFSHRAFSADKQRTLNEIKNKGFDNIHCITNKDTGFQVLIAGNDSNIVIAFRGTADLNGWITDFNFSTCPFPHGGQVHRGFHEALEMEWDEILTTVEAFKGNDQTQLWVTGLSLGGSLAAMAGIKFKARGLNVAPLYTYAAPPTGDLEFCNKLDKEFPSAYFRFLVQGDMIPRAFIDEQTLKKLKQLSPDRYKPIIKLAKYLFKDCNYHQSGQLLTITESKAPDKPEGCPILSEQEAARRDIYEFWKSNLQDVSLLLDNVYYQATRHNENYYLSSITHCLGYDPSDLN